MAHPLARLSIFFKPSSIGRLNVSTRSAAVNQVYSSGRWAHTSSRLKGKVAIVTGASSGLGRAIALRYGKEGAHVVCADLRPLPRSGTTQEVRPTHELIKEEGDQGSIFVQVDVGDSPSVQNMVQTSVKEFGRVDMYAVALPATERSSY